MTIAAGFRIAGGLASRRRNLWFRFLGVRLEGYCWLRRISIPRQWGDIRLQAGVALDDGVTLLCSAASKPDKIVIGARSYVNRNVIFDASESIVLGEDCMVGPGCYLTDHDHVIAPGQAPRSQPLISSPTRTGNRVWLGAHAVILKGVSIGDDAVVAAGAVVTKDVPARARVAGVPARLLEASSWSARK